ncbi:hypothetical protein LTSESEN_2068, partial [Salmonella enterica subsp. enterica serovar Senftenberg str. A4-543]
YTPLWTIMSGRQGKVITVGDNVFIIPDSLQHYWLTAG